MNKMVKAVLDGYANYPLVDSAQECRDALEELFAPVKRDPQVPAWAYREDKEVMRELRRLLCVKMNTRHCWHNKNKLYIRLIAPTKLYKNYLLRLIGK